MLLTSHRNGAKFQVDLGKHKFEVDMKGTQKQEALEQLYGKPLKDILVDLHLEYEGNVARVAARLGIPQSCRGS